MSAFLSPLTYGDLSYILTGWIHRPSFLSMHSVILLQIGDRTRICADFLTSYQTNIHQYQSDVLPMDNNSIGTHVCLDGVHTEKPEQQSSLLLQPAQLHGLVLICHSYFPGDQLLFGYLTDLGWYYSLTCWFQSRYN